MRIASMYATVVVLCVAGLVFAAGCKTTASTAMSKDCSMCPTCKTATVSVPVKDATCNKIVCPGCGKETPVNESLAYTLRNYVGDEPPATVRMCPHCKCAVVHCAKCRKG
jgi:hypothetical protein